MDTDDKDDDVQCQTEDTDISCAEADSVLTDTITSKSGNMCWSYVPLDLLCQVCKQNPRKYTGAQAQKTRGQLDRLSVTFSCQGVTSRWPILVLYSILSMSAYNTFVLWTRIHQGWTKPNKTIGECYLRSQENLLTVSKGNGWPTKDLLQPRSDTHCASQANINSEEKNSNSLVLLSYINIKAHIQTFMFLHSVASVFIFLFLWNQYWISVSLICLNAFCLFDTQVYILALYIQSEDL